MKFPRDVAASRVIRLLEALGYEKNRQTGSHIRLRHPSPPAHAITVPNHLTLKIGTLRAILLDVAAARQISLDDLLRQL